MEGGPRGDSKLSRLGCCCHQRPEWGSLQRKPALWVRSWAPDRGWSCSKWKQQARTWRGPRRCGGGTEMCPGMAGGGGAGGMRESSRGAVGIRGLGNSRDMPGRRRPLEFTMTEPL